MRQLITAIKQKHEKDGIDSILEPCSRRLIRLSKKLDSLCPMSLEDSISYAMVSVVMKIFSILYHLLE